MTEPIKPRALTYTEMMNGGCQQIDDVEQRREREFQQRVDELASQVEHLEQTLQQQPLQGGNES